MKKDSHVSSDFSSIQQGKPALEPPTNTAEHEPPEEGRGGIRKQILFSGAVFLFLAAATIAIVLYGSGYRFSLDNGRPEVAKTGILVTTSNPNGAQVLINDHLTTATDNTINLTPGEYRVKIFKEGYFPWEKTVRIQKEVVTKAEALLFPTAPKLESITATGVSNPMPDPSGTKIAYIIAGQTIRKNGIYVFDLTANPVLSLQGSAKQIVDDTNGLFSQSSFTWSPDGQQLIASLSGELETPTYYLLSAQSLNDTPRDITAILTSVQEEWRADIAQKDKTRTDGLKEPLQKLIKDNFTILAWSPDDTSSKILYIAKADATLPLIIKPRLIGVNTLREDRNVTKGAVYAYDTKEDTNWKILDSFESDCIVDDADCRLPLRWFPDSKHLSYVYDNKIDIMEYDASNQTTIYAGPFIDNYVFPWPNGSKIIVLTNLNNLNIPPNLYTISLK
ncbi:MAG: PEGA domain-containing protein [Candidatus Levybacteria bacterium]|nr:PEGA domain-containing protein [Candidatus Levybacteria bacterium]